MNFHITSQLPRIILLATGMAIITLFSNCKKSTSSSSSGGNTTWFLKLTIGDSVITNSSGTGMDGLVISSGNATNSFVGGLNRGYGSIDPGIIIQIAGSCNTSATNPCLSFSTYLSNLAVGAYSMTDTTTATNDLGAFGVNEVFVAINDPANNTGYFTYFSGNTIPITNLTFNITSVGNIGQNISGNFTGTILKINTISLSSAGSVAISGSFNVYRAS